MRATVMHKAGDVRIENVPDPKIQDQTDAILRITCACICGSDLWPYKLLEPVSPGRRMGHEAIGVIEAVGREVHRVKVGDLVVMPFAYSDGTCDFCHDGLPTSCVHGGFFGTGARLMECRPKLCACRRPTERFSHERRSLKVMIKP